MYRRQPIMLYLMAETLKYLGNFSKGILDDILSKANLNKGHLEIFNRGMEDHQQVNRKLLDFDYEKVCSVTLSNANVYACLKCGKYFQGIPYMQRFFNHHVGRSKTSPAYMHSLQEDHRLYINLNSLRVFLLPESNELADQSPFDDIRFAICPRFSEHQIRSLSSVDANKTISKRHLDLHGKEYICGFVGMNNIKCNDSINAVLQALLHVNPLRDHLLRCFTTAHGSTSHLGIKG